MQGGVALQHQRLAIIDVAGSAQPMEDPSGRFALTYNGEIFNFRELRRELEAKGHSFRTSGDVEVLLRWLMEEGEAGIARLDGQFAFAFHDRRHGSLLLARDRLGVKPLYVARTAGEFLFASELKALLPVLPGQEIDPVALDLYLALRYVPAPFTIFRGIRKLPPASVLRVLADGREEGPFSYFHVDEPVEPCPVDDAKIEAVLGRSVGAQLVSDVPLCVLLSGGVDSSVVACLAARAAAGRLRTLTVGFSDAALDERRHARAVAQAIASDHRDVEAGAAAIPPEERARILAAFDEPFADSSVFASDLLYRTARQGATVALSGDGGDELFFGYRSYHRALAMSRPRPGALAAVLRRLGGGARRGGAGAPDPAAELRRTRTMLDAAARRALYRGTELESLPDPLPAEIWLDDTWRRAGVAAGGDPLRALMFVDLLSFLPECVLVKADRLAMRHGLEVRVPLLGNDVLDLARRLPLDALIDPSTSPPGGKRPLKAILARAVPTLDTSRRKRGFGSPAKVSHGRGPDGLVAEAFDTEPRLSRWLDRAAAERAFRSGGAPGVRRDEAALVISALAAFLRRDGAGP